MDSIKTQIIINIVSNICCYTYIWQQSMNTQLFDIAFNVNKSALDNKVHA